MGQGIQLKAVVRYMKTPGRGLKLPGMLIRLTMTTSRLSDGKFQSPCLKSNKYSRDESALYSTFSRSPDQGLP